MVSVHEKTVYGSCGLSFRCSDTFTFLTPVSLFLSLYNKTLVLFISSRYLISPTNIIYFFVCHFHPGPIPPSSSAPFALCTVHRYRQHAASCVSYLTPRFHPYSRSRLSLPRTASGTFVMSLRLGLSFSRALRGPVRGLASLR
jgi:hypothetical protein